MSYQMGQFCPRACPIAIFFSLDQIILTGSLDFLFVTTKYKCPIQSLFLLPCYTNARQQFTKQNQNFGSTSPLTSMDYTPELDRSALFGVPVHWASATKKIESKDWVFEVEFWQHFPPKRQSKISAALPPSKAEQNFGSTSPPPRQSKISAALPPSHTS